MSFPELSEAERLQMLAPAHDGAPVDMVLDTDTYNEIDDQFALTYALLAQDRVRLQAVYAAPFYNARSSGPADGMQKSYEEIVRILRFMGRDPDGFAFRGAETYLPGPDTPADSEAVRDLIDRARGYSAERPLYVVAVGAITNVASAILMEPDIIRRIVVVWLGGHPPYWHTAAEFNLQQDMHASRLMFDCGVPLVQVPCKNVAEHVRTTLPEIEQLTAGCGAVGDYLCTIFREYFQDHFGTSKVLWDITAVAWLVNPQWTPSALIPSPILTPLKTWSHDPRRHHIRVLIDAHRDPIFRDLARRLKDWAAAGRA